MAYRVMVVHLPYAGPSTPSLPREWFAVCLDPMPVRTPFGYSFETKVVGEGRTRDEAIENLQSRVDEHLRFAKAFVEFTTIEAPVQP